MFLRIGGDLFWDPRYDLRDPSSGLRSKLKVDEWGETGGWKEEHQKKKDRQGKSGRTLFGWQIKPMFPRAGGDQSGGGNQGDAEERRGVKPVKTGGTGNDSTKNGGGVGERSAAKKRAR